MPPFTISSTAECSTEQRENETKKQTANSRLNNVKFDNASNSLGGSRILRFDLTNGKEIKVLCNDTTHLSLESAKKNIVRSSKHPNSNCCSLAPFAEAASLQLSNRNLISEKYNVQNEKKIDYLHFG